MKLSISLLVILLLMIVSMVGHSLADGHRQVAGAPGRIGNSGQRIPTSHARPSSATVSHSVAYGPVRVYGVPGRVVGTGMNRQRPPPVSPVRPQVGGGGGATGGLIGLGKLPIVGGLLNGLPLVGGLFGGGGGGGGGGLLGGLLGG